MLSIRRVLLVLSLFFLLSLVACATTGSTTETFGNTTETSTDFTSSTSSRDSKSEKSSDDVDKVAAINFANANMEKLRVDAMAGGGEYINSVGLLLGVKKKNLTDYGTMVRDNFDKLFSESNVSAEDVIANLDSAITKNPQLRKS